MPIPTTPNSSPSRPSGTRAPYRSVLTKSKWLDGEESNGDPTNCRRLRRNTVETVSLVTQDRRALSRTYLAEKSENAAVENTLRVCSPKRHGGCVLTDRWVPSLLVVGGAPMNRRSLYAVLLAVFL